MAEGFQVNPGELEGSGQSAKQIAEQMPGETAKVVGPSDTASTNLKGWQLAGALHDCTSDWKTLLDKLGADMDAYGDKLISMAQAYRASDQDAAASMGVTAQAAPAAYTGQSDPFGTKIQA